MQLWLRGINRSAGSSSYEASLVVSVDFLGLFLCRTISFLLGRLSLSDWAKAIAVDVALGCFCLAGHIAGEEKYLAYSN
jgi:hypothetical protein